MASVFFKIKAWSNWRALLISVMFGLFGAITMWADMRIPQIPDFNIGTDVREIFVILGAWFGGPLGGFLGGIVSALYSSVGDWYLHLATIMGHALAGFAMGMTYRPNHTALKGTGFALVWLRAVLVYYFVLLASISFFVSLFAPSFFPALAGPGKSLFHGYLIFWLGALPEFAFVLPITLIMMLAWPHSYRKPLWDVDKPANP